MRQKVQYLQGDSGAANQIRFYWLAIWPGEYRLKIVWDKAKPYGPTDGRIITAGPGDYQYVGDKTIKIQNSGATWIGDVDLKEVGKP